MAYLKLTSYGDALEILLSETRPVQGQEKIALDDALGRIAIKDVSSPIDVPPYVKSQMDGYAVLASDTFKASEDAPIILKVVEDVDAGNVPTVALKSGECSYVATGAALPDGADSVIMLEDVVYEKKAISVDRPAAPGENLMAIGYDISKGETIVAGGERLSTRSIASLSGVGISEVDVFPRPKVSIISTGSEIILPGGSYSFGKTYDVNGAFLSRECERLGCEVSFLGIAEDSKEELMSKLDAARGSDVILVSAGVSKGAKDLMETTLSEVGEVILHGINIKPGKPTLASRFYGSLLIGLPGHPTSCVMIFKMLVEPLIFKAMGSAHSFRKIELTLMKRVVATKGRKQFLPVSISGGGAYPVFRGSGAITSFLKADGIAIIDENTEYLDKGEKLEVVILGDQL